MTFKFKHVLAVMLAAITVACSIVGTIAVSAAETGTRYSTENTVSSDVADMDTEPTKATETAKPSQPSTKPTSKPSVVPPTKPIKPSVGAIKNLTRTKSTTNSLSFKWNKVKGATGYVIYYRNNDAHKNFSRLTYINSNACTVKKLKSGTWYDVKIAAYVKQGGVKYEGKSQT